MSAAEKSKILLNGVFAGLFIGIAGTVYLAVPNTIAGAFLFAFGLMTILCYNFKLFTGAIGYLMTQKKENLLSYTVDLVLIWGGNLIGCYLVGTLIRCSRTFPRIDTRVTSICAEKLADGMGSLLILSFFCGILMYVGVEAFRKKELDPVFRFAAVFLCVAIFILSGFEHCIANMYYFSAADAWSASTLITVLWMTLGNALGGWLIPLADKFRK